MLTRREASQLRALRTRPNRQATGRFLVEGARATADLLTSSLPVEFVVVASSFEDTAAGAELRMVAERRGVRWSRVEEAEFAPLAETDTPQGVIAVAHIPTASLADVPATDEPLVVLVLDAVQDPGNFGTLVRTAEALGAAAVLTLPGTVDPWNPKAVRASMGSSFRLPIVPVRWEELAPWLRQREVLTLAAAAGAPALPRSMPRRAALVVGNEGAGISAETAVRADLQVGIPLRGRAESLNVAAAAAILLHELLG